MYNYKKHNAPKSKVIYVGDENGYIRFASLLSQAGRLRSAAAIKSDLEIHKIKIAPGVNEPVLFIGAAKSTNNKSYYLRAQTLSRFSVYKHYTGRKKWKISWSSYDNGSDKWASDGTNSPNPANIRSLPVGATITDNAYIVSDSIVVPINVPDPLGAYCAGSAYYYLYNLEDGTQPNNVVYTVTNTAITGNLDIGYGKASRLTIADIPGKNRLAGFAHADKKKNETTGVNESFYIHDKMTTGVRSWRIIEDY